MERGAIGKGGNMGRVNGEGEKKEQEEQRFHRWI